MVSCRLKWRSAEEPQLCEAKPPVYVSRAMRSWRSFFPGGWWLWSELGPRPQNAGFFTGPKDHPMGGVGCQVRIPFRSSSSKVSLQSTTRQQQQPQDPRSSAASVENTSLAPSFVPPSQFLFRTDQKPPVQTSPPLRPAETTASKLFVA